MVKVVKKRAKRGMTLSCPKSCKIVKGGLKFQTVLQYCESHTVTKSDESCQKSCKVIKSVQQWHKMRKSGEMGE